NADAGSWLNLPWLFHDDNARWQKNARRAQSIDQCLDGRLVGIRRVGEDRIDRCANTSDRQSDWRLKYARALVEARRPQVRSDDPGSVAVLLDKLGKLRATTQGFDAQAA